MSSKNNNKNNNKNKKKSLYDEAFSYLERAEKSKDKSLASMRQFYIEACHNFIQVMHIEDRVKEKAWVKSKVTELLKEIDKIKLTSPSLSCQKTRSKSIIDSSVALDNANFHYDQALSIEQALNYNKAKEMYKVAADLYLEVLEHAAKKGDSSEISSDEQKNIRQIVQKILNRMKELTKLISKNKEKPINDNDRVKAGYLSKRETKVLMNTSRINNILCYPFLDQDLHIERYTFHTSFTDPDGLLTLSSKQKERLGGWKRPHQIFSNPRMIDVVSPYSIKQTLITDCSFISSLAVSSHYERVFRQQLITSVIYPQNSKGLPVYNPSGKYMIKLILNGVARKVIIDDLLPVDRHGKLICSFSSNPGELWVSLIEKAFLKVHGGYAFPGSNGGVDLHILTGWIPERISMKDDDFQKQRTWERMTSALKYGDCLITASTGQLDKQLEDDIGLVSLHAYAVLKVEKIGNCCLLQLKNPWSRVSWKGKFSPYDANSWTPELRKRLGYEEMKSLQFDNGVFWIDYESFLQYYGAIYMNWSPNLFTHRCTTHYFWPLSRGPKVDSMNREFCPQYRLIVDNTREQKEASIWVLLSKHSIEKKEEEDEYIAVHIYKDEGERVYYPSDPYIRGTYINNPHHLTRFDVPHGKSKFIVIVSQYEKLNDFSFTLNVYSTAAISFMEIPDRFPHKINKRGSWELNTAGGSANYRDSFLTNPQFIVEIDRPQALILKLAGPKQYAINIMVYKNAYKENNEFKCGGRLGVVGSAFVSNNVMMVKIGDSEAYRNGFCYCIIEENDLKKLPPQINNADEDNELCKYPMSLTVVVSTYNQGEVGPFFLTVGGAKTTPTIKNI